MTTLRTCTLCGFATATQHSVLLPIPRVKLLSTTRVKRVVLTDRRRCDRTRCGSWGASARDRTVRACTCGGSLSFAAPPKGNHFPRPPTR